MRPLPTNGITTIHTCAECIKCDNTILDTTQITAKLENLILPTPMPAKIKVAVAGCKRCCTMPLVRDIGLTPVGKRWRLSFGGNGGRNPRIADIIAEGLNEIEAIDLTCRCLMVYQKYGDRNMRTSTFIETFGLETFKEKIFQ
jgi:NAD(P)H-nitrite reductase large subunit